MGGEARLRIGILRDRMDLIVRVYIILQKCILGLVESLILEHLGSHKLFIMSLCIVAACSRSLSVLNGMKMLSQE